MSNEYALWGWKGKELHAGTLVTLAKPLSQDPLFGQIGLIISNATPATLSKFSSKAISTWLNRGPPEVEVNDKGEKYDSLDYYVEPAYVIKFGELQTIYSYSEITVVSEFEPKDKK